MGEGQGEGEQQKGEGAACRSVFAVRKAGMEGGSKIPWRRSRRLRFVKECLWVVIRSVCKNFVDMRRAVAYIRYHIVFRACLRACGSLRVLRVLWKHPGKTASALAPRERVLLCRVSNR